ncbi:MAG: class I SAM-dependent methyltransferase [Drouetiella hepatica Uher 2000/2452]|jgi:2-polyprenyl-3-methyl-5-hydroxy-6-metoxy-1,4-benzoquinol methylase|uniref:Class I SAM-dependent methyltransferase n=1 Tax=Drouetiella hepatica Uher 2000/2452 TaxID=904376 RepID=A0A951QBI5_9CYAN|nr:class I SAM-dependent methyltransferase [Drouetiella hepatica Uher 2000/2452]
MANKLSEVLLADDYKSKPFHVYYEDDRHEMIKYIPADVSLILDIGCASGRFGQILKEIRQVEVWGIEPNEDAASVAGQRLDKVINSTLSDELDIPEHSFDCIIFNDVLEHLVDPFGALTYCKKILRNNGYLVISIPNVRYFDNIWKLIIEKEWKYEECGILDRTHLRFFTESSILRTLDDLGFQTELIEGINPVEKKHPHQSRKFNLLNCITLGRFRDMRYLQFAIVARPKAN